MALQGPSSKRKKNVERKRNSLRRNDRKGFHKSLSTSLQPGSKKITTTSILPSLKENNKQLAVALDAAKHKIRRSEESIITLQQERQELLERNVKSEKLIQSLQAHLPKAELLLNDADDKIAAAKQSVIVAKEMLLEYSIKEPSSDTNQCTSAAAAAATVSEDLNTEQSLLFDPVMASTPQHSPREDVTIHDDGDDALGGSFDIAITDQLQCSPNLSDDEMTSFLSPLQDVPTTSTEADEGSSFKVSKTIKPVLDRTPRPKRHCTELATSYAEDDLMRKLYGEEISDDKPAAKRKKFSKNNLKKKPALSNITNVLTTR